MSVIARIALIAAALTIIASPTDASQPTGRSFGAWKVSSTSSLSGVDGDDPLAILMQDRGGSQLSANWNGKRLQISILIKNCVADDDFDESYEIGNDRLKRASKSRLVNRLRDDFSTWLAQAKIVCGDGMLIDAFGFRHFNAAAADFVGRIQ
ncbi:MAG: hypothetical protein JF564_07720 [Sphingomonas sp.]|nr:hypothetical protein [Sphingomonas sp.]